MIKFVCALAVAVFLYVGLSVLIPATGFTMVSLPWLGALGNFSFKGVGATAVFALLMGK